MTGWKRAASTLVGAGLAGALLWAAAQIGRHTTGGYWASYSVVAGAGLVLALSQLRGQGGNPLGTFLLAFLPVLVVAGWVLAGMQPHPNWFRSHVLAWSGDIGVSAVMNDVGMWLGVLSLGIGFSFGATLEPVMLRRRRPAKRVQKALAHAEPVAPAAANEPIERERAEVGDVTTVDRSSTRRRGLVRR